MYRLTTDNPKNNYLAALNLFYVKDEETWVRGGGAAPDFPDVPLDTYIKDLCKAHGAELDTTLNREEFDSMMAELLFDGPGTIEGLLATLYAAGWAFASLRWALKTYEDLGIPRIAPAQAATIDAAIIEYGENAQMDMAIEEMAELTKAICKRKRTGATGPEARAAKENLIEEIADVFIMLLQLVSMFDGAVAVQQTVDEKLHRLKGRLEGGDRANEQQQ